MLSTRVLSHLRIPLYRNGYALLAGSATTSGLGLVYWGLAARLYSAETVGLGSAVLSAMLLLSGISQLSLNNVLVRFVPLAGRETARLAVRAYALSAGVAAVLSLVFTLRLDTWAPALKFLGASQEWQLAFVLATVVWCIFSLQDSVLTGLRQALWVPLENTAFAIAKIVLLIVLAGSLGVAGIFASWIIPVLLSLLPVNLLIFSHLMPRHLRVTGEWVSPPGIGRIVKFVLGNYLGSLLFLASTTLLPVMVTSLAGASANAYFYPPWMIVTALQLVAHNMSTSLTVEATLDRARLSAYARRVLVQIARLVVPLVIIVFLGAPVILQLFGSAYAAEGTALLRLLAVGVVPNVFVALSLSLARVQNRPVRVMIVHGALSLLVLGLSFTLLPTFGITGVGIAWLVSQSIVAAALFYSFLRPILQETSAQLSSR